MAQRPWYREMHWQITLAVVLALVIGRLLVGHEGAVFTDGVLSVCEFVGGLFLRALKMVIVPLVLGTVIAGVASLDVNSLGKVGAKTLLYYLSTTALAVIVGIIAVNLIEPGSGIEAQGCTLGEECGSRFDCVDGTCMPTVAPTPLRDVFWGIVPTNPFASIASTFDLLGVITFALLFGIALSSSGERGRPLLPVLEAFNAVIEKLTWWIMAVAPIGIGALLVPLVARTDVAELVALASYMATVAGALLVHACVTLPALLWLFGRVSPRAMARAMSPALLTAWSTASSSATLPVTMESLQERAGVGARTTAFVTPLGATVNMDGTALYEAVAALFIAQAMGIELGLSQQIVIFVTATLAAIGAAGVPSAGLVTMIVVLETVGLPIEGIALLLAVDRPLDMLRTTVNVWGDACGAAIIGSTEGDLEAGSVLRD